MNKRILIAVTACYLVTLGALAFALLRAAPAAPSAAVRGLAIGAYGRAPGIAFISGNRLSCTELPQPTSFDAQCEIAIAGKPLRILARNNPPSEPDQLGGACQAQYDGRSWPCQMGMRHVHINRFAYIDGTLGLSFEQFDQLRRTYPIENLPEGFFVPGIGAVAIISALLAAWWAAGWLWPRLQHKTAVLLVTSALSVGVFFASLRAALAITSDFWD
jgi:hypothetical protein